MNKPIRCDHCGKPVFRDPVLFRLVPHESGCWVTPDHLAEIEKTIEHSNPFVPGVSIKRADLIAMVCEIKTYHALLAEDANATHS